MSKRKKKQERQRTTQDFVIELQHFEIASGYDGLFRGAPEVTLVVGVYALGPRARTLTRTIFRAAEVGFPFPQVVPPVPDERTAVVATEHDDSGLLVVTCGIEDDGGGGVARVFGALERSDALTLASADKGHDVLTLPEITPATWSEARRAIVMVDGVSLQAACAGDDWVGAAAVCVARTPGTRRQHRFHLATDDLINDWTIVGTTKVGWRA